jgi:hypothetical protein
MLGSFALTPTCCSPFTDKIFPMMAFEPIQHLNDDTLELIALNRLSEPNLAAAEEHLLVCEACRRALTEMDSYVRGMRKSLNSPMDQIN